MRAAIQEEQAGCPRSQDSARAAASTRFISQALYCDCNIYIAKIS